MRILVSAAGMLRMAVVCFVLGVMLGVYFGVAGTSEAVPQQPATHTVDSGTPMEATAP